jgi:predicted N-acetyltransferase YhbS
MASPNALVRFSVKLLAKSDYPAVVRIVNDAFMVDAFFKKPEFHNRLDAVGSQLDEMTAQDNHAVLVAHDEDQSVVGCVHVHWYKGDSPHGAFGMLSVSAAREKAGIGKLLVRAAGQPSYSLAVGVLPKVCEQPSKKHMDVNV